MYNFQSYLLYRLTLICSVGANSLTLTSQLHKVIFKNETVFTNFNSQ